MKESIKLGSFFGCRFAIFTFGGEEESRFFSTNHAIQEWKVDCRRTRRRLRAAEQSERGEGCEVVCSPKEFEKRWPPRPGLNLGSEGFHAGGGILLSISILLA